MYNKNKTLKKLRSLVAQQDSKLFVPFFVTNSGNFRKISNLKLKNIITTSLGVGERMCRLEDNHEPFQHFTKGDFEVDRYVFRHIKPL